MAPKKVGAEALANALTDTWFQEGECLRVVQSGEMEQKALTDLFYPTRHSTPDEINKAKAMCAVCPVQRDCLDFAIRSVQTQGIWGGTTQQERRKIRRQIIRSK